LEISANVTKRKYMKRGKKKRKSLNIKEEKGKIREKLKLNG
jgi:hypothetical protein